MNMTKFAIDYNRFIYFLVIALTLFGINSYFNLPKVEISLYSSTRFPF